MSALTVALLLAASSWSDTTGRLRCEVPDGFTAKATEPWRFSRADGLRQLVFLTVRPVSAGPAARAKQLLERTQATAIAGDETPAGTLGGAVPLAAAFAIAKVEPTWAGVLVLGPPSADVAGEAKALAAQCRTVKPAVANGRVYDSTRRLSAAVPPHHGADEQRGAGAVQGERYTIRMSTVQPKGSATLEQLAIEGVKAAGATPTGTSGASAGLDDWPVVVADGTYVQNGVEWLVEVAIVELGSGEIGGLVLTANAAVGPRAKGALDDLLRTLTVSAP